MSNIFTYEIDERNLRIQLKSMEVPLKEEAWQKFEAFSNANPYQQPKGRFKGFEINLNRSVVLPAVFGIIIILFSFLLVNFITIKNVPSAHVQKSEVPAVTPKQTTPVEFKAQVSEFPLEAPKTQPKTIVATEEQKIEKTVQPSTEVSGQSSENAANQEMEAARVDRIIREKRRKKAEEEALSAIKPTIVSDETDAEILPN